MDAANIFESLSLAGIEEVPAEFGGPGHRCSAWLTDGTYLPCVFVRRMGQYADRSREMLEAEFHGQGAYKYFPDPVRESIRTQLRWSNRVASYNISRIEPCRFAIPMSLLTQVRGETAMSLWLFVLETADGRRLAFNGSSLPSMIFFHLPDDIEFREFKKVHNVHKGKLPAAERSCGERLFFEGFVDDEPLSQPDLSSLGIA